MTVFLHISLLTINAYFVTDDQFQETRNIIVSTLCKLINLVTLD